METKTPATRTDLLAGISARIGGTYDLWGDLNRRIAKGQVIPVLGNSVVNNCIFDIDQDGRIGVSQGVADEAHQFAIDEQLATRWAEFIKYPIAESPLQLCRVAQYNQVHIGYREAAKAQYLTFLKLYLLQLAMFDDSAADVRDAYIDMIRDKDFDEIQDLLGEHSFSEIAYQLGYPRYESEQQDPLHLLAQLPLPIYVTTSHHDFLERALVSVDKKPIVQVCSWFGDEGPEHPAPQWYGAPPEATEALDVEPAATRPLVYHLYGLEKHPASIVISEDDYMEFLVQVSEDRGTVPLRLRRALAQSSILLLGYRLRCWDFRVLFRGIIQRIMRSSKQAKRDRPNVAIQLNPPIKKWETDKRAMEDYVQEAKQYRESYLTPNFRVEWNSTAGFAQQLLHKWRESQR